MGSKYSLKIFDHAKESVLDPVKTASKKVIQKTAETTGDLIDNKTADKTTKVSRTSTQNSPGTVESETENIGFDREIPKERYISPVKRQKIIDDLKLI